MNIPAGTACVLTTAGSHAIPVSTAVVVSDDVILFGLGRRRESLRRLLEDPRVALTVMSAGQAFTAHGTATEAGEVAGIQAVRLDVERVQDHMTERFAIRSGVVWEWTDAEAEARDAAVRAGLADLGIQGMPK